MPNRVDISTALDLKLNHNLSYARIAKIQGVHPSAVHKQLKDLLPTAETRTFQENRADIFSEAQLKLLSQIDAPRLKKMTIRDAIVSLGILYDKEQLERGNSPTTKPILVIVKGDNTSVTIGDVTASKVSDDDTIDI